MVERRTEHLIYLGSQAGKVATPKASVYAASKHALIGYTNALRMEVAPFGIDVTTINPGPIDTVVDAIIQAMEKPVRDVNLPWYMGVTSKLHAVAGGAIGPQVLFEKVSHFKRRDFTYV